MVDIVLPVIDYNEVQRCRIQNVIFHPFWSSKQIRQGLITVVPLFPNKVFNWFFEIRLSIVIVSEYRIFYWYGIAKWGSEGIMIWERRKKLSRDMATCQVSYIVLLYYEYVKLFCGFSLMFDLKYVRKQKTEQKIWFSIYFRIKLTAHNYLRNNVTRSLFISQFAIDLSSIWGSVTIHSSKLET